MNQIEDNTPPVYNVDSMGPWSILEQDIQAGKSRFEKKDCRIQSENSRAPYQELKTSHTGRINPERHLMKMEYQEDLLNELGNKDFVKQTIIEQAQKSYDGQRLEKLSFKRMLDWTWWARASAWVELSSTSVSCLFFSILLSVSLAY